MPDRICAAAPVSGYASIQKYVPYEFAREIDPRMSSIIQGSLSSYRHELLVQNAKGIRIQLQHGSSDDNVPTFHSRRMLQLLRESGSDVEYYEIPGKGHWYPGIMATIPLLHFYKQICQRRKGETNLPTQFTIINPGTGEILGSRGGIIIEQLRSLGQLGHLDIHRMFESLWNIKTSNIRRLRFGCSDYTGVYPTSINIDDILLNVGNASSEAPVWLYLDNQYQWKVNVSLITLCKANQISDLYRVLLERFDRAIRSTIWFHQCHLTNEE